MLTLKKMPDCLRGEMKFPYHLYLPEGCDPNGSEKWPLVIFLHGAGEAGTDGEAALRHGLARRVAAGEQFPFIIAIPQEKPGSLWNAHIESLNVFLDYLIDTLPVDPDRVTVTGFSMGGTGAWCWAIANADRFAALVPICGVGIYWAANRIRHLPTWVFHGDKDVTVPFHESTYMVEALKKCYAADLRFTICEGWQHNSWDPAYDSAELYEWILAQNRTKRPDTISYQEYRL